MVKSYKPSFEKTGHTDKNDKGYAKIDPVTKYMATDLITFTPEMEIIEVIDTLLEERISGAPVLNEKKEVVGMIDDKDCLRALSDSVINNQPVSKCKTKTYMDNIYKTMPVTSDVLDVANEFLKSNYKRFLIVDEKDRLIGQVSRRDILLAIKTMNITTWHNKS